MEEESKFRFLLIRISKLLTKQNVQQLLFTTIAYIDNRTLFEECEQSGNALKIFQAMIERDLYTYEDPSLLIQHLDIIGRQDAVRMVEQEMGVPSHSNYSTEQQLRAQLNQGSGERIPIIRTAALPHHPKPGPSTGPDQQATPLPLDKTQAFLTPSRKPKDEFADGACNPDAETTTSHTGIQTADIKRLEPEASLFGDATSSRYFPDIPERHHPSGRDTNSSSTTGNSIQGLETGNCPEIPERPPRGSNGDMKSSSATGYNITGSQRTHTAMRTPARHYHNIPERPPRVSSRDTSSPSTTAVYSLPLQESQEIVIAAVPQQTAHAARPVTSCHLHHQQPATRIGRPQDWGLDGMFNSRIEVEQLQGRPPPVPGRPQRRHERASHVVEELELSLLSRHFDAGVFDLLGHELEFGSGRISQLRYENPHDVSKVFYRLMVEWRNRQHGASNMRQNLANHLRSIGCVGLAGDLEAGQVK